MRTREIKCIHYVAEGSCDLGHKGTFNKACQHCKQYRAAKGTAPRRVDTRRRKLDKINKRDKDYGNYFR
jgi:hypothetical protein